MSAAIPPVESITADTSIQPTAGGNEQATDGGTYVVTDSATSGSDPTTITAPQEGEFSVAVGTESSNVLVEGDGTATINIGIASTSTATAPDGTPVDTLDSQGSSFQVSDDYQGSVVANLSGAIVNGDTKVDTTTPAPGGGTIGDNAPSPDIQVDYYVNTGAGSDQVQGSAGSDFVRAGEGDDTVNAGAGDDIVRLGTGNDTATLGDGADQVYFTVDQLQFDGTKTITDFKSGEDKLTFAADANPSGYSISDDGQTLTLTFSNDGGATTYTTTIVSQGDGFQDTDLEFLL